MPVSSWLVCTSSARARLAFLLNSLEMASESSLELRWVVPTQNMAMSTSPKITVALPPYGIFAAGVIPLVFGYFAAKQ